MASLPRQKGDNPMVFHDKAYVERLRKQYPDGTRIELIHTDNPYTELKLGDQGTVWHVDDTGTLHVDWDSGSTLGVIPGEDSFKRT